MTNAPDLTTAEGARAWLGHVKDVAMETFLSDGAVPPLAIFIITRDDRSGRALTSPREVLSFLDPTLFDPAGDGKDKLALWMRRFVRIHQAIGFAFVTEAWSVTADIRPRSGSWENVPGRREILAITAQHRALGDKTIGFESEIIRENGTATLAPWREGHAPPGHRFTGVLATEAETSLVNNAFAKMVALEAPLTPEQRRHNIERVRKKLYADGRLARAAVDVILARLVASLEEAGSAVAARPEDLQARAPDNDAAPPVDVVDIDEWSKR